MQHVAQRLREADADLRLHGDLVERVDDELDRLFDRDDVQLRRRDHPERRVERRRLPAAGWSGHQDEAVRARQKLLGQWQLSVEHPEVRQVAEQRALGSKIAKHQLLAERHRHRRYAHLDFAVAAGGLNSPVLRPPLLGDVEPRQRLDP